MLSEKIKIVKSHIYFHHQFDVIFIKYLLHYSLDRASRIFLCIKPIYNYFIYLFDDLDKLLLIVQNKFQRLILIIHFFLFFSFLLFFYKWILFSIYGLYNTY